MKSLGEVFVLFASSDPGMVVRCAVLLSALAQVGAEECPSPTPNFSSRNLPQPTEVSTCCKTPYARDVANTRDTTHATRATVAKHQTYTD